MDSLDDVEICAFALTGDIDTAISARKFIADALDRGILDAQDLVNLTIQLQEPQ